MNSNARNSVGTPHGLSLFGDPFFYAQAAANSSINSG